MNLTDEGLSFSKGKGKFTVDKLNDKETISEFYKKEYQDYKEDK